MSAMTSKDHSLKGFMTKSMKKTRRIVSLNIAVLLASIIISAMLFILVLKNMGRRAGAEEMSNHMMTFMGAVSTYAVRGDESSRRAIKAEYRWIFDPAHDAFVEKKTQRDFFASMGKQVRMLSTVLLAAKNPNYRSQLSVSVKNMVEGLESEIVMPEIEHYARISEREMTFLLVIVGLAFLLVLAGLSGISRSSGVLKRRLTEDVARPIAALSEVFDRMSTFHFEGDLSRGTSQTSFDEIAALRLSVEKMARSIAMLLDKIPGIGIVIAEADASGRNEIIYQNAPFVALYPQLRPHLEQMTKKSLPPSMMGQSIHVMHGDPDRIRKAISAIRPGEIRTNSVIPVGPYMMASFTLAIPGNDGRTELYATIWQDKTSSYRLKEAISRTSGDLSNLVGLKGEFASVVSATGTGREKVSTLSGLTSTVRQVMESVRDSSLKTNESMERVVGEVSSFREEIRKVAKVVQSITAIAGQTHVLSLNAAIEAARAGDEGRGFMVVADSVRDLASNTGNLTTEIDEKISAVLRETEKIVDLVSGVNKETSESLTSIGRVAESFAGLDALVTDLTKTYERIAETTTSGAERMSVIDHAIAGFDEVKGVTL